MNDCKTDIIQYAHTMARKKTLTSLVDMSYEVNLSHFFLIILYIQVKKVNLTYNKHSKAYFVLICLFGQTKIGEC